MNFKLNLMLIPFTVPRTAFNYLPSCDTIILNFPFRLAKSRLRRLFAGRPLRWVSPFSIIISTLEKGVGQIRLLFLHCEGKSAALSLEGLTVGALIDRRVGLMCADGNAVQRTVRSGRTMVCALLHRTVNGLVAAIVTHREWPPFVISVILSHSFPQIILWNCGNAFRCAILKQKTLQ